jgi:hypothetical protein
MNQACTNECGRTSGQLLLTLHVVSTSVVHVHPLQLNKVQHRCSCICLIVYIPQLKNRVPYFGQLDSDSDALN